MFRPTVLAASLSILALPLGAEILRARPAAKTAGTDNRSGASVTTAAPAAAVTPATFGRRETVWDEAPLIKQVITFARGAALEVPLERMGDWQRLELPPFAAAWAIRGMGQVHCGAVYLSGPQARAILSGNAWSTVPSTLVRDPKDGIRTLINDDSQANSTMIRPMGFHTRVYAWESVPAAADSAAIKQIAVAVGDDNQAYVFVFEGPAEPVTRLEPYFESLVSAFEPSPEVKAR